MGVQLLHHTLSQTALMTRFTPAGMALRETFSALLTRPELNRAFAEQLCAFDVAYPEAPLPAPPGLAAASALTGRCLPDQPLQDEAGTTHSLYSLLHTGRRAAGVRCWCVPTATWVTSPPE